MHISAYSTVYLFQIPSSIQNSEVFISDYKHISTVQSVIIFTEAIGLYTCFPLGMETSGRVPDDKAAGPSGRL